MILLAYSGTGKSYLASKEPNIVDLEDYLFYIKDTPQIDYDLWIRHLFYYGIFKEGIALSHPRPELRERLLQLKIPYILVMPNITLKDEYIKRFQARGSREDFITNQEQTWVKRHHLLPEENIVYLKSGEYLENALGNCFKLWNNIVNNNLLLEQKRAFVEKLDIK